MNAKTEKSLSLGVAQIAEQIPLLNVLDSSRQLPKDDAGIEAAGIAVAAWLSHQANTKWLLVLDNVDNQTPENSEDSDEAQREPKAARREFDAYKYIPQVSHGSVLVTSRLSFLSRAFGAQAVQIHEMSTDEGISLLCKASRTEPNEAG